MIECTKPEMCSVIVTLHETIGQCNGLALIFAVSVIMSMVGDRLMDVFELS